MNKTTTPTVPGLLQEAVTLHQAGKLDAARRVYQQILLMQSDNFEAMHFLGVIARQGGQAPDAIAMISHAIDTLQGKFSRNYASAFCNLGTAYQDNQQPDLAMKSYMQAIELRPDYAIAHNNLGNALKKLGRLEDALQSFQNALAYSPNYAEAYFNAGLVLQEALQFDSAVKCFDRAIQIKPGDAETWFARANAFQSLKLHQRAIDDFDHALKVRPEYAKAWLNRGISLSRLGHYQDAAQNFEEAIRIQPRYANAFFYLANNLKLLQKIPEAIAAYRSALEYGADPEQIEFCLATLGVGQTPVAAPKEYIRNLFDQYADHFDQHLIGVLAYEIPKHLGELIDQYRQSDQLKTLDLGCGTGLCAMYLRPYSTHLTGVDLSQKMLDKAARLNLYNDLICDDVTGFLEGYSHGADLIVAADVMVYLGDLHPVFHAVERALNNRGYFCFSVEEAQSDKQYVLNHSSRYAHGEVYLRDLAKQCGLTVVEIRRQSGRLEKSEHNKALIVLLQKIVANNTD